MRKIHFDLELNTWIEKTKDLNRQLHNIDDFLIENINQIFSIMQNISLTASS